MAEPKAAIERQKFGAPAMFVHADNATNFERKIELHCTIVNVPNIEIQSELMSPNFYVQSLPFYIVVKRERKRSLKNGNLNIRLVVGRDPEILDEWSSTFSVVFDSRQVIYFKKFVDSELSDTNDTVVHSIDWENVSKRQDLSFEIQITADIPAGEYEWPSYMATGHCGLVNEGATCYINCLLQSLFFTNEFRSFIYGIPIDTESGNESFLFWLKYIFCALQTNKLPKITTKKMIKSFSWDGINETDQQDVQEFLRLLLDRIEQAAGAEFKQRLRDLFVGVQKATITCGKFGYTTSREEEFWDIALPIDESTNIFEAVSAHFHPTKIDE